MQMGLGGEGRGNGEMGGTDGGTDGRGKNGSMPKKGERKRRETAKKRHVAGTDEREAEEARGEIELFLPSFSPLPLLILPKSPGAFILRRARDVCIKGMGGRFYNLFSDFGLTMDTKYT